MIEWIFWKTYDMANMQRPSRTNNGTRKTKKENESS